MKRLRRTMAVAGVALLATCARNPVTGERELALISESQEIEMGRQAAGQVEASIGLVENEALQSYIQRLGAAMAADAERPRLPWTFRVVDDPTPNAFALPGGYIYITRGMINYMDSEAELAAVLGHEIAHVTARHSVQQISRAQLAQLGLGLGMIFVPELQQFGGVLGSGLQLLFLKHGRDAERQADELGFRYSLAQGYDVREMDDVFATLQQISQEEGRSPLPAWASTHPDPGERIEAAQVRAAELGARAEGLRLGRAEFMNAIDGLVWGDDPRQGYFENGLFLHPELRFAIRFPQGWRTQNLRQAVLAGAPQQDALMQLTLAQGTPDQAARRFFGQQGVQAGRVSRERVNDLPATLATFQAQTQQGVVQGVVGFVAHGERTYEVVGFAPANRYGAYERAFLQVIGSFSRLTDPRALNVQPRRIDVVRLPRAMTLTEFARQYPTVADMETLMLINQAQSPTATLPAGSYVKRVVER